MSIEILVRKSADKYLRNKVSKKILANILECLLDKVKHSDSELSVLLTSNYEIKKLNSYYRGQDRVTDVLSFPAVKISSHLYEDFVSFTPCLGDIVISLPRCKKQALEQNVTLLEELTRLLIHGLLHLCGYDHENVSAKEAQRMKAKEKQLMKVLIKNNLIRI